MYLVWHLAKLAGAFRVHAARLRPEPAGPVTALPPGPAPEGTQQEYEERVLAALLRHHPDSGRILSFLPVAAFTGELRQELFQAIRRLDREGRPVDALTVDWEHSERTLGPGGTGTYTVRLASAPVGVAPLKDAYALLARLQRRTPHTDRRASRPGQAGHRRRTGAGTAPAAAHPAAAGRDPAPARPRAGDVRPR